MLEQEEIKGVAKPRRILRIVVPLIFIALALACGIAAGLAALYLADTAADSTPSRYFADSWASASLCILIPVSVILPCSMPFLLKCSPSKKTNNAANALSWLVGLGAIALFVYIIMKGLGVSWDMGFALIALGAAVFFMLKPLHGREAAKIFFSFGVLSLGIAIIAMLYFDREIELNSPYKLAVQFGAVGVMLGTLADAREVMSRITLGWSLLIKSTALTLTLTCIGSVVTAFAVGNTSLPEHYLIFALFYLPYSLMTATELLRVSLRAIKEYTART